MFVEQLRQQALHNKTIVTVEDLGAGSRVQKSRHKTVRQIAKAAVKPKKYSHFLYRLVQHYKPQTIIELGTSLGISTAYMAIANPGAQLFTIEGSKAIYEIAHGHFKKLELQNVTALHAPFDEALPPLLDGLQGVDLAYIDGNHRYQPTLHYFQQLLPKAHSHTILIFDDIHWSAEMEEAWQVVQQHPMVQCTIDIFFMGIVFLRQEFKTKQHFSIKF